MASSLYKGMVSSAISTYTISLKRELKQSPMETVYVLQKWNVDLAEDNHIALRLLLCQQDPADFEIIEFFLDQTAVDIQYLDWRSCAHTLCIALSPSCFDWAVYQSFEAINKVRMLKRHDLAMLLEEHAVCPKQVHIIISDYCYAPYHFKYDDDDYDERGNYKVDTMDSTATPEHD